MTLKQKIISVLYEPDWDKYQNYRKNKRGWPINWNESEKKLKGETADKILKIIKEKNESSHCHRH